ncbi:MAG TPA: 16S rRNA (cytosine(1402)-N(4))-methyltransferase RsmH [Desulfatiglandales bacterium]|nr:16S rRNA (cytosine(1402)-N(4))-methyltransferase RsmH [Desulfatiglandales bacterium]
MLTAHQPVMVDEAATYLITAPDGIYVDGTAGTGGHSLEICKRIAPEGRLICLDVDRTSLRLAEEQLASFGDSVRLVKGSYADLDRVLQQAGIGNVHGILLDLGLSSYQLEHSGRGFSFLKDEPLDMRMDQDHGLSACELINTISMERLQEFLWHYAEERWAKRIARAIIEERRKGPVTTSRQLARLIETTIPLKHRPRKIHPATKTFQALRIAVNGELQNIADFLSKAPSILRSGGRLVVISYHSLEDRLVKQAFRERKDVGRHPRKLPDLPDSGPALMRVLTKKGLRPSQAELIANPRSRSAIMRVAERI